MTIETVLSMLAIFALIHLRALKSIMMAVAPLSNHHRCSNYIFCLLMTRARLSLRF
ncbi:Uncharacterised protein [Vibrio cholerae]|nr:Uncharacterised protein [Vibrio cholerae]